ncbi:hypothetical protein Pta6605_28950 [Pseudomonas amygdali pv. tabaci]|nr:hypothetical protein Pta6605_28950 [Pseudomonas amygdali pv. tabaci]
MAAQFKEVILTPNLLHMQQFGPEAGQGDFDRTLRRFIGTAGDTVAIRCRQTFAVQFAVRRDWQAGQPYKSRRHHVFGQ